MKNTALLIALVGTLLSACGDGTDGVDAGPPPAVAATSEEAPTEAPAAEAPPVTAETPAAVVPAAEAAPAEAPVTPASEGAVVVENN